jgi:hypothetical protein
VKELEQQLAAEKKRFEAQLKSSDDRDNKAQAMIAKALQQAQAEAKRNRERADKEIASQRKAMQEQMKAFERRMEARKDAPATATAAAPATTTAAAPAPDAATTTAAAPATTTAAAPAPDAAATTAAAPATTAAAEVLSVLAAAMKEALRSNAMVPASPANLFGPQALAGLNANSFGPQGLASSFGYANLFSQQQQLASDLQRLSGNASSIQQTQLGFLLGNQPFGGFPFGGR